MIILELTNDASYNFFISQWIWTNQPLLIGLSLIALLRN
jgi:hypothetical protein